LFFTFFFFFFPTQQLSSSLRDKSLASFCLWILLGSKDTCRGAPNIANYSNRGKQTEIDQHIPHTCVCDSSTAQCHGCGTWVLQGVAICLTIDH
jgi:hypothetical protein